MKSLPLLYGAETNASHSRVWVARGIAMAVDLVQVGAFFTFPVLGYAADDVIDVVAAGVFTLLVGWHIAFLPSFLLKLVPFADLAPTWTIAVWIATSGKAAKESSRLTEGSAMPLPEHAGSRA